jgi:hypothetical protein
MFGKQHRFTRLAAGLAAVAVFLPVAQAAAQASSASEWGEYGMPRAMPADYNAHFAAQLERGDYGMPRAMPVDYQLALATAGGDGFDWADAGIGAGVAFGLVVLALAAAVTLRGGRKLEQA